MNAAPEAGRIPEAGLSAPTVPVAPSSAPPEPDRDWRPAVCRWEGEIHERHPHALRLLDEAEARALLREVFSSCGMRTPRLVVVPGFSDPDVGGFADLAGHRILIEDGFLHLYLILHEAAHLLVPEDRRHGPAFVHVLKALYATYLPVPEENLMELLRACGLPEPAALSS